MSLSRIDSNSIAANAISAADLAESSITEAKIAANAIVEAKIADSAVTPNKISGQVPVTKGGTGVASLTANAILLGNGTSAVATVSAGNTGNVLTSDGNVWISQAIVSGGNYEMTVFTSPGTWTKPSGLKAVKVTVVGGGGGGKNNSEGGFDGKGGGAGGAAILHLAAPSIPGPVTVTRGAGGAGSPAPSSQPTRATSGGTSSFGPFASATGGQGGTGVVDLDTAGGVGSSGDLNIRGGQLIHNIMAGGNSIFVGGGGISQAGTLGGGGGGRPAQVGLLAGGAGGDGLIIVEEFY